MNTYLNFCLEHSNTLAAVLITISILAGLAATLLCLRRRAPKSYRQPVTWVVRDNRHLDR